MGGPPGSGGPGASARCTASTLTEWTPRLATSG